MAQKLFPTLILLALLLSLFSCTKEETIKVTPFWKIMEGNWKIEKNIKINGVDSVLTDIETESVFKFFEEDELREPKNYSTFSVSRDQFGNSLNPRLLALGIRRFRPSTTGFKNERGMSFVFSKEENIPFITERVFSNKFYHANKSYDIYERKFKIVWLVSKLIGDNQNYTIEDFDQIDEVEFLMLEVEHFQERLAVKLKEVSASTIRMIVYYPIFGRKVNGKDVMDEIELTFKKLNSSTTISIPPFSLNDYDINFKEDFNNSGNMYLKNGAAIVGDNCIKGNCLNLPSTTSYAESTFGDILVNNWTVGFWINPKNSENGKSVIFSKYRNRYGPYIISIEDNKVTVELNDGSGNLTKVQSYKEIISDSWNHICITIDENSNGKIYLNGLIDSGGKLNNVGYDADGDYLIGITEEELLNGDFSKTFQGKIDELILVEKALSSGEVYQLFKYYL